MRTIRFFNFMVGLATVAAFYFSAKAQKARNPMANTLQFAFLPVAFPLFFLIYTDITSLLFVLLMVLSATQKRPRQAGLFGLISCLIRQTNVVWVAFVLIWSYVEENGWSWAPVKQTLGKYWVFLLTGALFFVFLVANRGVAIGDAGAHPATSLHLGNVFFLLFLCFFLFVPFFAARHREALSPLRTWPGWFGALRAVCHVLARVLGRPSVQYAIVGALFAQRRPHASSHPPGLEILFFVPVALAALWLRTVRLRGHWWLLYPFTILFLLPAWLIEQRYYLIPLSLFLLAREPISRSVEGVQVGWFFVMSIVLFVVVERGWIFM